MITLSYTTSELETIAQTIAKTYPSARIFTLSGTLGAGKTTLAQTMLRLHGVTELITSPTFTYVNIYTNSSGTLFYHFDCYRITSLQQFIEAGFDEYLNMPNSFVLIEWPEIITPLLTHNVCSIYLSYQTEGQRSISFGSEVE